MGVTEKQPLPRQPDFSFESVKLIASVSASLINLKPGRFKAVITRSLRKIAGFTEAGGCFLALFSEDRIRAGDIHVWPADRISSIRHDEDGMPLEAFPWALEKLAGLENIRIFCPEDLPPAARAEKKLIRSLNVSSLVAVPVEWKRCLIGCLGLMTFPNQEPLGHGLAGLLRMLALSFAGAYERIRLEKMLLQSERKYRLLIENAPEAISLISEAGRFLHMNKAAAEYLHGQPEEFVGKTIRDLFPGEIAERRMESILGVIRGKDSWVGDEKLLIGDEERWFKVSIYPVRIPGDRILAAQIIARDVTQNHKIEIRDMARLKLLNRLRNAEGIDDCLMYGCEAVYDAELFKTAVLIMHDETARIVHSGWFGIDDRSVENLRNLPPPAGDLITRAVKSKDRFGRSYLVFDGTHPNVTRSRKIARRSTGRAVPNRVWGKGCRLVVPVPGKKGGIEGWLLADAPFSGRMPSSDQAAFLEELVDAVAQHVHRIQDRERLRLERQALEEKNIALTEVLTHIEEEKMEIKRRITESIDDALLPILDRLAGDSQVAASGYIDLLRSGLADLASLSGGSSLIYPRLSAREKEICMMIKNHATNKEIAGALNIAVGTVRKHRETIRRKLGLTNKKVNLVAYLNNA